MMELTQSSVKGNKCEFIVNALPVGNEMCTSDANHLEKCYKSFINGLNRQHKI